MSMELTMVNVGATITQIKPQPVDRADGIRVRRPTVFAFPGQGPQYPGMSLPLRADNKILRAQLDAMLAKFGDASGVDLMAMLQSWSAAELARSELAQLPLFAVEYALARTLAEYGVMPDLLLGHSLGELVAATVSGVLTEDDAVRVVCAR